MKIFTSDQLHELDRYTIEKEPVASIDLMERAAKALTLAIMDQWNDRTPVVVFAGPGNNGGDALAVARMLLGYGYNVKIYLFNIMNHLSDDCAINRQRLHDDKHAKEFVEVTSKFDPPELTANTLVVDGLFGTGQNKPLAGGFASLVKYINHSPAKVVSIDMPSGLMTEDNSLNVRANIIRADLTLTFHQKKLAFFFADAQQYIGQLKVLDIRLSQEYVRNTDAKYMVLEEDDVRSRMLSRDDFAHKGLMGNALLIAGSYGMTGAAILASRACLRSGVGKLTTHVPQNNYIVMQTSVPEAVLQLDADREIFSEAVDTDAFDALGIGPGLGQEETTAIAMISQIRRAQCPIVADADALNILANHRAWVQQLPRDIILTPHPLEFDRLSGVTCSTDYERLTNAQMMAQKFHVYIVLKGHNTAICLPDGHVCFCPTGNSGMATAGSGDVLTGVILGLLARGYRPADACVVGTYLHGLAGDLAVKDLGKESLVAGDLVRYLPKAFLTLQD